jgi:molecular chaperone GrpE
MSKRKINKASGNSEGLKDATQDVVTETAEDLETELVSEEELKKEFEEESSDDASDDAIEVETESIDDVSKIAETLVKAEMAVKEGQEKYQRAMAEFENFRKRTIREKAQMHETGAKEVLEKLLPVVDNFDRAISHISDEEKELAITQGVEKIFKQLMGAFNELGVEEIDALNKQFDPNLHHAVSHEENEDYDDNMVQEVFQKGYMFKDSVLRHSMVKVVN